MTKLFVINKLNTRLDLKSGYIDIPIGGYATINESDKNEPTIAYAEGRDWIEITDKEPKEKTPAKEVLIEDTTPYEGMTEEELLADKAKAADTEPVPGPVTNTEPKTEAKSKKAK